MVNFHILHTYIFDIASVLVYILYFAILIGMSSFNASQYLSDLQYYMKIYVSLFLIIRFNPFRRIEFTDLDRRISFLSGVFLFTNLISQNWIEKIIPK